MNTETETAWFYESRGHRLGPATKATIIDLISTKVLTRDTLVWNPDLGNVWKKAGDVIDFSLITADPPGLPVTMVNNGFAWALAVVPFIGAIIENQVDPPASNMAVLSCYFLVNSVLSYLDIKMIERAGYKAPNSFWLFLTPVYMWKRENTLGRTSRSLFWVWLAAFPVPVISGL